MSSRKGLMKNIASLGIVQIANFVMPLISVPIISRIIGPEKFGAISYVAAFVTYFNLFIGYGFNLTAIRKISADPDNLELRNSVFSEVFYCQILLFILSMALFSVFVYTIPDLSADKRLAFFSIIFCISSVLTQNWLFQAMHDLSKIAVLNLSGKVLYIVAVLTIIQSKSDYYWQPLILSITQILVALLSFLWARKKYYLQLISISFKDCIRLLWKEKTVFFSMMLTTFYTTANIIILGFFQSDEQVGFYTAGQRLILVAQTVITLPLAQVFYPIIGRALSDNKENGLLIVQRLVPVVIIVTGLLGFAILLIGPIAFEIFYGEEFYPGILAFQILAFVPMLIAINNIMGIQVMMNLKMDNLYFKILFCGASISIISNIYMSWKWGYIGSSINWLATEALISIVMYKVIRMKNLKVFDAKFFNINLILFDLIPSLRRKKI